MRSSGYILTTVFLFAFTFMYAGAAFAQEQEITGTVIDSEEEEPLPGVNVAIQGTTVGTTTDVQGNYTITASPDDVLIFSFVGYTTVEEVVGDRTVIDVEMAPGVGELDELVVIGYGEQRQRDVTGSLQTVDSDNFNQAPLSNPEELIAGKVSGLQVSAVDGAPGAGTFIRVRGSSSVNAGNEPLFVIDGVPVSNEGNRATRNPLNFLSPDDIESMTVLKDASATAIYGSRGANGVILIETKQAREDEGQVTYSGTVSTSQVSDRVDMLDRDQLMGVVEDNRDVLSGSTIDRLGTASTNWQDEVERQAFRQEHNVSLTRGYEDADFRFSLGYMNEEGVLHTSSTERTSVSFNYNQRLFDDRLSISADLRGSQTQDDFEPGGIVENAAAFDPTQPVRDVNSPFGGFFEWGDAALAESNPVAQYVLSESTGEALRSVGNVEVEYDIPFVEGLSVRSILGYDVETGEQEVFQPSVLKDQAVSANPGLLERANFTRTSRLLDAFLSYENFFPSADSRVDVTLGYSYQDFESEFPEFTADSLSTDIFGTSSVPVTGEDRQTTFVSELENRLISGFARVNYEFAERYLATFTVRRDGSSRFGPANQWGTFPSAALSWRLGAEPFMERFDFISTLRLRASWGITGNQEIGDFLFEPTWSPGGSRAQARFGDRFVGTIRPSGADEGLKWEETTDYNIGVNFGLLDERLTGELEFYYSETDDLLFEVTVPAGSNLTNRILTNIGNVRNRGVEFSVDGAILTSPEGLSWNAQFNASANQNELLSVDEEFEDIETGGISGGVGNTVQLLREGEPLNSFFLYEQEFDEDGRPIVPDETPEREIMGDPEPDWILGHTSRFGYQNFDLSFTLRAHLGGKVYNNNASNMGHLSRFNENQRPTNLHESVLETGFNQPEYFSDFYLEDASFLRVDNISLGYTTRELPGVSQARIFTTARNLFVLSGYSGPDPEVTNGIDNSLFPRSRSFTAGVNLQF